jgi:predicted AAA+ superfamily ATPase
MVKRTLQAALRRASRQYPVVTLTGPRQSGKTTLVRSAFPKHRYVSLEDPDQREFAHDDPRGFLDQFRGKAVLDEAQRAPDLFSYIQTNVDEDGRSGKFILTGSHNFLLMRTISQSLAGRSAILHLLPFSLSELEGRSPLQLSKIGVDVPATRRAPKTGIMEVMFRGFYPRIHDKRLPPQEWLGNYYRTYVERDVREIVNVGDIEAFGRFVRLCAGRNGQLLNLSSLASDCGVTHTTARRWLSILEASFLVILLRPHHRNFSKRMIKSPKLYFLDSGLLCYLLRIQSPEDLRLHASRGSIFESFIVSELIKNYFNRGEEPGLYFWRDLAGHEVDVLMDRGRKLVPIEIKSGQTVAGDFFENINYWREIAGAEGAPGALFYGGEESFRRTGVAVYPWSCL